jgi:hypothetical protein
VVVLNNKEKYLDELFDRSSHKLFPGGLASALYGLHSFAQQTSGQKFCHEKKMKFWL